MHQDGKVRDAAILIFGDIDLEGSSLLLWGSASLGEHEIHWCNFLESFATRGLWNMQLITSDDQLSLKAVRMIVFSGVTRPRYHFYIQRNASAYVPHRTMLSELAADIRAIFNMPDSSFAENLLEKAIEKNAITASQLAG